jgi:hypothetical protein
LHTFAKSIDFCWAVLQDYFSTTAKINRQTTLNT